MTTIAELVRFKDRLSMFHHDTGLILDHLTKLLTQEVKDIDKD